MLAIAGYKLSGRMLALEDNQMHLEVRTTGVFVLFLFLSALMLTSGYIWVLDIYAVLNCIVWVEAQSFGSTV